MQLRRDTLVAVYLLCALAGVLASPVDDTVFTLPGYAGNLPGSHRSGYVATDDGLGSKMWYFFSEYSGPKADKEIPLLVWLNGGPGCSSLVAVFHEHGAFLLDDDGKLTENQHGWNRVGHVLYLDNPVGVGLSFLYDERAYVTNEEQVAKGITAAVSNFLKMHPEYASSRLYLVGESYAGKYILHTASYLMGMPSPPIAFKGVAIGDGLVDPQTQRFVYPDQVYANALLSPYQMTQLGSINEHCLADIKKEDFAKASASCDKIMSYIQTVTGNLNPYDLRKYGAAYNKPKLVEYINSKEFRIAAHVSDMTTVLSDTCNGTVSEKLSADRMVDASGLIVPLLKSGLHMMFYNGQFDLKDGPIGTQKYLEALDWPGQEAFRTAPRTIWRVGKEVAGYARETQNLRFVVIQGAGHFAPMDQRAAAADMMEKFTTYTPVVQWEGSEVPEVCKLLSSCNGHGECTQSGCQCHDNYAGGDCSHRIYRNVELGIKAVVSLDVEERTYCEWVPNYDEISNEVAIIDVAVVPEGTPVSIYVSTGSLPSESNFETASTQVMRHTKLHIPWKGRVSVAIVNHGNEKTSVEVSLRGSIDSVFGHYLWRVMIVLVPVCCCSVAVIFVLMRLCCCVSSENGSDFSEPALSFGGSSLSSEDASAPFIGPRGVSLPAGEAENAVHTASASLEEAASPLALPVDTRLSPAASHNVPPYSMSN